MVMPGATDPEGGTGYGPKGFPEAGHGSGGWVGFGITVGEVGMRVGISYVSEANARANLDAENPAASDLRAGCRPRPRRMEQAAQPDRDRRRHG